VKLDGIWGGGASYPGKPYCTGINSCRRYHKTDSMRRTRSGKGAEGGRFTRSTDDPGPVKPGNRVEDKTLATRKVWIEEELCGREPAACDGQHTSDFQGFGFIGIRPGRFNNRRWIVGSRGREAIVVGLRNRNRVARKRRNQKAQGGCTNSRKEYQSDSNLRGQVVVRFQEKKKCHLQPGNL